MTMPPTKPAKEADPNRALRLVVVSMGMLLIGGTILLFVLAFKKIANDKTDESMAQVPLHYRQCGEHMLKLDDLEIERVSFDGTVARLVTRTQDGQMNIVLADSCTGKKLGSLTLKTR